MRRRVSVLVGLIACGAVAAAALVLGSGSSAAVTVTLAWEHGAGPHGTLETRTSR